jgi:hypothetical protein
MPALPAVGAGVLLARREAPIEHRRDGQMIMASYWNELVDAINRLNGRA